MLTKTLFFILENSPSQTDIIFEYLIKIIDKSFLLFNSEDYQLQKPYLKKNRRSIYYYVHSKIDSNNSAALAFDELFYLKEYPDVSKSGMHSFQHFNEIGWKLGYNPNELFDVNFYLKSNEDVKDSNINPFVHYMTTGYKEQRLPTNNFNNLQFKSIFSTPIQNNINPLAWYYSLKSKPVLPQKINYEKGSLMYDLLIKASAIEPKIAFDYFNRNNEVNTYYVAESNFPDILKKELSTISTKPDYIIILPWLSKGGSDWEACVHINYLMNHKYNVVLITTENEDLTSVDWLVQKPTILSLSKYKKKLNDFDYCRLLLTLCVHLKPKAIHNNNSQLGWELYKRYGKQLSSISKIYASIFCHDFDINNIKSGYITTYLNDCIKHIDYIFTDNIQIIHDIKNEFGFTQKTLTKFKNIYYLPQKMGGKEGMFLKRNLSQIISESARPKVLWASRISIQKRVDILLKIVQNNPHIDFHIYGYIDSPNEYYTALSKLPNAVLKGKYSFFSEILDINYIALLYTSSWDGLPNVLIEACLAGLPVISSNVGGIGELINQHSGYLIEDIENIDSYSKALNDIIQHPETASSLAKNAYTTIMNRHTIPNMENVFSECNYLI